MIAGDKYGRLTAVSKASGRKWLFACDCGAYKEMLSYHVKSGASKSCGCLHKELVTTHGMHKSKEYSAWLNMKARCNSPNERQNTYKERGVSYPTEWDTFENFLADVGSIPDNSSRWSLERINNELPYSKENCCWALPKDQSKNRCQPCNNTSGHTGITVLLEEEKYVTVRARVVFEGVEYCKRFTLGKYGTLDNAISLAVEWRNQKLREFGFSETHGKPLIKMGEQT